MKRINNIRGWTLVEMLVVVAIVGIFIGGFAKIFSKNVMFFKQMRVRQQVMQQSRSCMERIDQVLRNGKASTLVISTPAGTPILPNSRADFELKMPLPSGTTAYAIYLEDGTVYGKEYRPGQTPTPEKLASHVTGLMFTGDATDPGLIAVSLQIDSIYDEYRNPPRVITLVIPNRVVHMAESP